jgi:hypothetical protein
VLHVTTIHAITRIRLTVLVSAAVLPVTASLPVADTAAAAVRRIRPVPADAPALLRRQPDPGAPTALDTNQFWYQVAAHLGPTEYLFLPSFKTIP